MERPSIDHGLLSPSGRISKRTREAAMKRERDRLFPHGYWDSTAKSEAEIAANRAEMLRRSAADLRGLATRGMNTKRFIREAEKMERAAEALEAKAETPRS